MDWNDFFERTRVAAKVESYSKLAPLLGITDGAATEIVSGDLNPNDLVIIGDSTQTASAPAQNQRGGFGFGFGPPGGGGGRGGRQ